MKRVKRYLIQNRHGATLRAFTSSVTRNKELARLREKHPRTVYISKDIK